ncbi:hypothetical protein HX870_29410 [Pseudomonas gingeri]|uniref:Uncharacterized protein n=1 Tax=Pseudomonas gingeri TaxID=117681 RepID=A0A7Y7XB55_9PSED|nr:hypothetical protein [Pseudomonas gingeri]NWA24899.1 hypothetical protein [Pseudomonas gingeri]NWB96491.1 hypothetical protein [Pseudomonas gingeri]NWD71730.1 hypothetical protein [Pseudomonas gingeri]NWD74908.1 hypothetical protein [Pseudomonas gingeri]
MNKQDTAFYSLLNEISQGKNEVKDPAEVDTLERLISFNYAQAVADTRHQQLVYSDAQMTTMGKAFLAECKTAEHPAR